MHNLGILTQNKPQLHKRKGFLLVEALIAITMLILVTVSSVSLMVAGYRAINYNAHSLTASWLAQECVNGLRGLRDTNWIRYSYDKDACWNISGDKCIPANQIELGTANTLAVSPFQPPAVVKIGTTATAALNLANGIGAFDPQYQLTFQDLDNTVDYDEDTIATNDRQFLGMPGSGSLIEVEKSKYYRMLTTLPATADCPAANCLDAICTVQWLEGSQMKDIILPITITNYHLF